MNLLEVDNICKTYGTGETAVHALKKVSFSVPKGEYVAIVGESGSGKSTLLNMIGALDTPTSGKVKIGGKDIFSMNDSKLTVFRRRNIGFIFQFYNILPTLTVLENVELVKDIVKSGNDSKEAIKAVGLEQHMNKFPNQLSGGEQQRVSIARALAKNPKIVLCDEPTGALDSKTGVMILKLLKDNVDISLSYISLLLIYLLMLHL